MGGGQDLVWAGAHPETFGQIHPVHRSGSVEQKLCRAGDVLPVDSCSRMEHVVATNRLGFRIRKKGEGIARFLAQVARDLGSIHADGYGTNPSGLNELQILLDTP